MEDDWDLHAVVRGCTAAPAATDDQLLKSGNQDFVFTSSSTLHFEDLFNPGSGCCYVEDLHELCKPFLPQSHETLQKQAPRQQKTHLSSLSSRSPAPPRSKRRSINTALPTCGRGGSMAKSPSRDRHIQGLKNGSHSNPLQFQFLRRTTLVPEQFLACRGYYRCSTSKGCTARKQVEKNRSDPGMLIVTYTGEHNHHMPASNLNLTSGGGTPHKKAEVSKSGEQSLTLARESLDEFADGEEDDGEFGVSKTELDDKFLTGLEELTVPNAVSGHELNFRL